MSKKTRGITLSAVFSALCVIFLFIASVWPTGQLGLVALSSLFVAAAVIESGVVSGLYVFIISSGLGLLILPNKTAPLLFLIFFGYYPIIKCLIERINQTVIQWILKLIVFNASVTILWLFINELFLAFGDNPPEVWVIYLAGSAVFLLYDYGYTKLIWFYKERISRGRGTRE